MVMELAIILLIGRFIQNIVGLEQKDEAIIDHFIFVLYIHIFLKIVKFFFKLRISKLALRQ